MGGVKTIDMRAHGSQKLWQKPCAHIKQKHKHMVSKTESLAMCRTGHEHAANKETHKPHVHTKHDKHESTQPMNTQAACHTEPDKTRESKTKTTKTHGQRSALPEQTWDRMLPQKEKTWNVSVRTPTWNHNGAWNKTRVPGSEHHAPTRVAIHPDFGRTVWIFFKPPVRRSLKPDTHLSSFLELCYVVRHCALCKTASSQWSVFETDITMSWINTNTVNKHFFASSVTHRSTSRYIVDQIVWQWIE